MKTPLHVIMHRVNKMNLDDQIEELMVLVQGEKPYSLRRRELLSMLQVKRTKQIIRNTRRRAKAAA